MNLELLLENAFGKEKAKEIIKATHEGNQKIIEQILKDFSEIHESEKNRQHEMSMLLLRYILDILPVYSQDQTDKRLERLENLISPFLTPDSEKTPPKTIDVSSREFSISQTSNKQIGGSGDSQDYNQATRELEDADYVYR